MTNLSSQIDDDLPASNLLQGADFIELKNIAFYAHHGWMEEENSLGQRFFLTIRVYLDLRAAGSADSVRQTIHYGDLYAIAAAMQGDKPENGKPAAATARLELTDGREIDVPTGPFKLLEALGHRLALEILRHFDLATRTEIAIRKPSVPIPGILDHAQIHVSRTRVDLAET